MSYRAWPGSSYGRSSCFCHCPSQSVLAPSSWKQRHTEQLHLGVVWQPRDLSVFLCVSLGCHTTTTTAKWNCSTCLFLGAWRAKLGRGCGRNLPNKPNAGRSTHSCCSHFPVGLHTRHAGQFHLVAATMLAPWHPWKGLVAPWLKTTDWNAH